MTDEAAALTRIWRVGRYTATLTVPRIEPGKQAMAVIEWSPSVPRRLNADELQTYRRGRDAAIEQLCAELGIRAAVLDL